MCTPVCVFSTHNVVGLWRTYGPWWSMAPSAPKRIKRRSSKNFISQDFVELEFNDLVYPTRIRILETYHPGAVVRILACNASPEARLSSGEIRWEMLWSGPSQCKQVPQKSREFEPPLKQIKFPTKLIRLEFNHEDAGYYPELDAVELYGDRVKAKGKVGVVDRALGFLTEHTVKLLKQLSLTEYAPSEEALGEFGYFGLLPDELIQHIMSYLDLTSLGRAAQTCSLLFRHCYDPSLYSELDLQPYWNTIDDCTLEGFQSRCSRLEKISLSWTGGCGHLTEQAVVSFIKTSGSHLTCLRLACCQFIQEASIDAIASNCLALKELDLQSCLLPADALSGLSQLSTLISLNLYRSKVNVPVMQSIIRANPGLQHLNLGACSVIDKFDAVTETVGKHCKDFLSIDLWRARTFTSDGLILLAQRCPNLVELDIGWISLDSKSGCFVTLFKNCKNLKKVFLTAIRSVSDSDMEALLKFCPNMEQVDILGTKKVSPGLIRRVASHCNSLKFFDVSFCGQLDQHVVADLRKQFPHIDFKRSFSM
ncbi:F-box/LRR-repeat protein 4-like isoform X2 [Corticium candelabrum]|uniref:F-box/LRR-repeat protein 4-like isoform X2 n=1 Tax=Corticium candelabrum TaxID=121492 RepID=UPI002E259E3B|nr:F-box/LRR-repeat protein 4-like isoform X2 [Corticium candelabrum]